MPTRPSAPIGRRLRAMAQPRLSVSSSPESSRSPPMSLPLTDDARFPAAVVLTLSTLFAVGASRAFVTRLGWIRSGLEMLCVGAVAAIVAYSIGSLASALT